MENEDNARFCRKCGFFWDDVDLSPTNKIVEKRLAQKLFYWQDRRTHEYKLSKSKIISEIVYLLVFLYGIHFYFFVSETKYSILVSVIATIILPLIFAVPVFAVGFLIHKFIS